MRRGSGVIGHSSTFYAASALFYAYVIYVPLRFLKIYSGNVSFILFSASALPGVLRHVTPLPHVLRFYAFTCFMLLRVTHRLRLLCQPAQRPLYSRHR